MMGIFWRSYSQVMTLCFIKIGYNTNGLSSGNELCSDLSLTHLSPGWNIKDIWCLFVALYLLLLLCVNRNYLRKTTLGRLTSGGLLLSEPVSDVIVHPKCGPFTATQRAARTSNARNES